LDHYAADDDRGATVSKFEIWESHLEQWDENDIDPPRVIEAHNIEEASIVFAERHAIRDEIAVIVRDESGDYFEIELARAWDIHLVKPTTLKELCAP
jgi:hypothetical protein